MLLTKPRILSAMLIAGTLLAPTAAAASTGAAVRDRDETRVSYQAHVQDYGWLAWVKDGEVAGTTGQSRRMEALKVKLPRHSHGHVCYSAHVQNIGWQHRVCDGEVAGTTGRSLRMEAVKIWLKDAPRRWKVCYSAHVQDIGWQDRVCDGEMAGTTGHGKRMEAVKIWIVVPHHS
jgi:uncharacterized protein YjdB